MCTIHRFCITTLVVIMILCGQLFAGNAPVTTDLRCLDFWVLPIGGYDWPTWVHHGEQLDAPISFTNNGDSNILFSMTPEEETAPSGWLGLPPELQGTIVLLPGTGNNIQSTIGMNVGGIVNATGTIVYLKGQFVFEIEGDTVSHSLPVECWVADTLFMPSYDTVTTGCFSLVVSNSGNFGNQGAGRVNLDYYNYGDCDGYDAWADHPENDTIPGNSTVYLYDASPVICWTDEFDTVRCNWSIYNDGFPSDNGFIPKAALTGAPYYIYDTCDGANDSTYVCETFSSQFSTSDTGILIEKTWYIPNVPDYQANDGANFIVQALRITSADGQTHAGLNIGEAIDWDIPADSGLRNLSGFDATNKLIYQQGSEYNDDPQECQDNSDRYGGIELLGIVEVDGTTETSSSDPYGAYSGSNSLWVYPNDGFVPEELDSLMTARVGYVISDSIHDDLHSVMTFKSGYTLNSTSELIVFKCLISSRTGYAAFIAAAAECHDFYATYWPAYASCGCCIGIRGNIDGGPEDAIDISDLVYLVDYMFTGGAAPPCFEEADVNGDGVIDISDLVDFVDYMFNFGFPPAPCP